MSGLFKIEQNILKPKQMLKNLGINNNGEAQKFFINELMRLSEAYLPYKSGMLKASARVLSNGEGIIYDTPYARMLWHGKVMVDPIANTESHSTYNVGKKSHKSIKKVTSNTDITFNDAPRRGSHWITRCYMDNKYTLIKATEKYIKEYSNGNNRSG